MSVIRVRGLSPIVDIIRRYELQPEDILMPLGISLSTLAHPQYEEKIEVETAYALMETVAEKTHCSYLGALIGCEQKLSLLGPIGLLMEHSSDVMSALKVLIKNLRIQQNLAGCSLEVYNQNARLTCEPFDVSKREGARHFAEASTFTLLRVLQLIIGPDFKADKICFSHPAPENITDYRRLAKTNVSFSEEENAIIFNKTYLKSPIAQPNDELSHALSNYLDLLREQSSNDLLTHLDFIIQRQLRSGHCTLELVAEEIHIHPRNLQRKLTSLGTSFRETLTAYRSRLAVELLKDPSLQITQIAIRLGYSDTTAFGQAFKKWFDKMPRDYRKQLNERR